MYFEQGLLRVESLLLASFMGLTFELICDDVVLMVISRVMGGVCA